MHIKPEFLAQAFFILKMIRKNKNLTLIILIVFRKDMDEKYFYFPIFFVYFFGS